MLIPKAELHLHLEGAIKPSLVRTLAARNKVAVPESIFASEETYAWDDFLHFLKVFDVASSVIRQPEDYYDLTLEYLKDLASFGTIYSEIMPSPDHARLAGLSYRSMLDAVLQAMRDSEAKFGIVSRVVVIGVRHFGVENFEKTIQEVLKHPHPWVVGLDIGGDEAGFPPEQFARGYHTAHHDGGLQCKVHAGEMAGVDSMHKAISHLPIRRIGHGVRAIEDSSLIDLLIDRDIALEICPTSNIELRVFSEYGKHPLRSLHERGVKVTLNSDDPPFFGTNLGKEYAVAKEHFGYSDKELLAITRTAIDVSFADEETKTALRARVDKHVV